MIKLLVAIFFLVLVGIYATNPMFKDPQLEPTPPSYDSLVTSIIVRDSIGLSKYEPRLDSLVSRFDRLNRIVQYKLNP